VKNHYKRGLDMEAAARQIDAGMDVITPALARFTTGSR